MGGNKEEAVHVILLPINQHIEQSIEKEATRSLIYCIVCSIYKHSEDKMGHDYIPQPHPQRQSLQQKSENI